MYSHHSDNGSNTASEPVTKHKIHEVLLEINDWALVKPLYGGLTRSYIRHNTAACSWINLPIKQQCCGNRVCKEKIPEEIIALWKLHNWETIQE